MVVVTTTRVCDFRSTYYLIVFRKKKEEEKTFHQRGYVQLTSCLLVRVCAEIENDKVALDRCKIAFVGVK